jgi:hypothetical protein
MNREDIEHMWKVASNNPNHDTNWHDPVVIRFAELVASAERKACAQIAEYKLDDKGITAPDSPKEWWNHACKNILDAIRARGQA